MRTLSGSMVRCFAHLHRYGLPLRLAEASVLAGSASRFGAPERSRSDLFRDSLASEQRVLDSQTDHRQLRDAVDILIDQLLFPRPSMGGVPSVDLSGQSCNHSSGRTDRKSVV
jgi:hypothetical protein